MAHDVGRSDSTSECISRPAGVPPQPREVRAVAARLARESPELLVHELRELPEKLGALPNPEDPVHFGTIEGNSVSDGRTTYLKYAQVNYVRTT